MLLIQLTNSVALGQDGAGFFAQAGGVIVQQGTLQLVQQAGQVQVSAGFFAPQLGQNLLWISFVPQAGQVQPLGASGRFAPHSGQNFDVMPLAPQAGQSQVSEGFGSGFLAPQSGQKRDLMFLKPQAGQSQVDAGASEPGPSLIPSPGAGPMWASAPTGAAGAVLGFMPWNMLPSWGMTAWAAAIPTPRLMMSPTMLPPVSRQETSSRRLFYKLFQTRPA